MTAFDVAAILVAVAAISGYVNHRLLRLPPTSGTLFVALVSSLAQLCPVVEHFLSQIDFDQTLMHGLLRFLLFAGAGRARWSVSIEASGLGTMSQGPPYARSPYHHAIFGHPPRSEAGQCRSPRRRHAEDARRRARESGPTRISKLGRIFCVCQA